MSATFPFLILITRSAIGAMAELCVITITVIPFCLHISCKKLQDCLSRLVIQCSCRLITQQTAWDSLASARAMAHSLLFSAGQLCREILHTMSCKPHFRPLPVWHPTDSCRSVMPAQHFQVLSDWGSRL